MAYTTVNKSTAHFNTKLYTGTGSSNAITGVGHQPDLIWWKCRNQAKNHGLTDVVRGNTKIIRSNLTNTEDTSSDYVQSFDSDGFTLGTNGNANSNGDTFCSWNWKGGGTGSSNSDATGSYPITSTVSANTTAGFSIVKYTGNGYSTATIGHGLGVKPSMVILKPLGYSGAWWIIHKDLATDNVLEFNTNAQANISTFGGGGLKYSTFTNAVIGGGNGSSNSDLWNKSGEDYIAYCFAEIQGHSKVGSYSGNANADGPFIYTGFKPSFVLMKNAHGGSNSTSGKWVMNDIKRNNRSDSANTNPSDEWLYASGNDAEYDASSYPMDLLSNGFKVRHTGSYQNESATYVYYAVGQTMVGTNNVCATAR